MVLDAHRDLDAAIDAARLAGFSWRQIGTVAGVPYQTLHRRHGRETQHGLSGPLGAPRGAGGRRRMDGPRISSWWRPGAAAVRWSPIRRKEGT
jgi:hypothetical protein